MIPISYKEKVMDNLQIPQLSKNKSIQYIGLGIQFINDKKQYKELKHSSWLQNNDYLD